MKTSRFIYLSVLILVIIALSLPLQSCDPDEVEPECDTCLIVYKPNIYLYPTEKTQMVVNLTFPMGGGIIASEPAYGSGWHISVDTNGFINNQYHFLFYESEQPDVWQYTSGWVVKQSDLEVFFTENLTEYGFADNEIQDFITYWIPRFEAYPYYAIYPQTSDVIDRVIELQISKMPDHLLRLFYVVEGLKNFPQTQPPIPDIDIFNRSGYFVTEWGVILK